MTCSTTTRLCLSLGLAAVAGCSSDAAAPSAVTPDASLSVGAGRGEDGYRGRNDDDREDGGKRVVSYAFIGDVPYEPRSPQTALSLMPALIGSINADANVTRAVHVGDIKSGSTKCTDAWFESIAGQFATFSDPLVYSIGDNEWTDCHRANNGGYNPLNRLAKVRELFFSRPGYTLGGRQVRVDAQRNYPENQSWEAASVTFSTFHVIGSNNGRATWFADRRDTTALVPVVTTVPKPETPAEAASREAEWAARDAANLRWLERTFEEAREERSKGVVLILQADLWAPDDRAAGADFSAHTAFVSRLATLARRFGKPVLLISGDTHDFRVDAGVPWFSLYGVTPVPNVTQLVVDRSIEADIDWVKLTIDPKGPTLFSWSQVFVPVP